MRVITFIFEEFMLTFLKVPRSYSLCVTYDSRSEGASLHEKTQKKVWFFRPIEAFKLGYFESDNLVIWVFYELLGCKNCHFLLVLMLFTKCNSLFEKTTARKNHTFFCAKKWRTFWPRVICASGGLAQARSCGSLTWNFKIKNRIGDKQG